MSRTYKNGGNGKRGEIIGLTLQLCIRKSYKIGDNELVIFTITVYKFYITDIPLARPNGNNENDFDLPFD